MVHIPDQQDCLFSTLFSPVVTECISRLLFGIICNCLQLVACNCFCFFNTFIYPGQIQFSLKNWHMAECISISLTWTDFNPL